MDPVGSQTSRTEVPTPGKGGVDIWTNSFVAMIAILRIEFPTSLTPEGACLPSPKGAGKTSQELLESDGLPTGESADFRVSLLILKLAAHFWLFQG
jgi:hypothetical protein